MLYAAAKGFVSTLTRGQAKELIGKEDPRQRGRARRDRDAVPRPLFGRRRHGGDAQDRPDRAGRATPEECVGAYLFLASEALSGYVVGQIIEVNGGQLMP